MKRRRRYVIAGLLLGAVALAGVVLWPPSGPLEHLNYPSTAEPKHTLVVLLPGIFDNGAMFEQHGFIDTARAHGLDADIVVVDADLRYYGHGVLVERLRQDVIAPARVRGYRRIVLVGVSLGGFGALLYANAHPDDIDRIIVISPFLGKGTGDAHDPAVRLGRRNGEDALWDWLGGGAAASARPSIFLAYGEQDKFAVPNGRLAQLMPVERVLRIPGEHEWTTWRKLWERMLALGWLEDDQRTPPGPANGARAATDLH